MVRPLRKIVFIKKEGLTRRGKPRTYWIVLECGHIILTSYSASTHIDEFCLLQGLEPKKRCRRCEKGEPIDVDLLSQLTPYRIWKAQNFDRFVKQKPDGSKNVDRDKMLGKK